MQKALIINGHHFYEGMSPGKLNHTLVELFKTNLEAKGYEVKTTVVDKGYDPAEEVEKHVWADVLIVQMPVNWMMGPWTLKKYIDEVYTVGLGTLCLDDGRKEENPGKNYGTGGQLHSKYMLSLTFNAPKGAFNDPSEYFFQGRSVDDLFLPMHLIYRFFNMKSLPTFVCYDVYKNPTIEEDLKRAKEHIAKNF